MEACKHHGGLVLDFRAAAEPGPAHRRGPRSRRMQGARERRQTPVRAYANHQVRRQLGRRRRGAPRCLSVGPALMSASGSGGERQSDRECPCGDGAEAARAGREIVRLFRSAGESVSGWRAQVSETARLIPKRRGDPPCSDGGPTSGAERRARIAARDRGWLASPREEIRAGDHEGVGILENAFVRRHRARRVFAHR